MPRSSATRREPRLRRGAFAALMLVGIAAGSAILFAPTGHGASAAGDRCGVPEDMVALDRPLPHVAARIAAGGTLTIVALGSSSTSGTGASRPENYLSGPSCRALRTAASPASRCGSSIAASPAKRRPPWRRGSTATCWPRSPIW